MRATSTTHTLGNACHAISSASVLLYTVATFIFAKPGSAFFDEEWVEHGFCVIQQDIPYWTSHDLCLYFDLVLVALGLLVYSSLRGLPAAPMKYADETMLFGMLGHLGHGIAHGAIGAKYRSSDDLGAKHISTIEKFAMEEDLMLAIAKTLPSIGFWFVLLKGVLANKSNGKVAIAAILTYIGGLFVTDVLAFAYIQAVISVAFASTQVTLPKEEKGFVYAAFALTGVPVSFIPWIESIACQSVASKFGGHLMYDVAIPVFLTVAYYASWRHYSAQLKDKEA